MKKLKNIEEILIWMFIVFIVNINCGTETQGSILRTPGNPKISKKVKISKSLFRDFLTGIYQIDHEGSENRDLETLGSILKAPGLKAT